MALPDTFTAIRHDEQGRAYVVHKPSGVWYYVREQSVPRHGGVVTTFSREKTEPQQAQRALDLQPRAQSKHKPALPAPIRARFIAGTEPKE